LQKAGALMIGKTNLDQFASGLAGDRSPYGTCRNFFSHNHISGGSSSGSALAVAAGLVTFALGTDTAGSGRVPAGCNNIVGLKPTPGLLSTEGLVPAVRSLDCVSFFAANVGDAMQACEIAADASFEDQMPHDFVFAVPRPEDLEFYGDNEQAKLFSAASGRMEEMGGRPRSIDFGPFRQVASLLYDGPWLAERLAGLEGFLKEHADDVYPVTRAVLRNGARFTGVDVFKAQAELAKLRKTCAKVFEEAEVLVVPTMPTLPLLAEVLADSIGWSGKLGYYTNFVNLLGWAALAVPAGFTSRGLPGGITLIGPAGSEGRLCSLGKTWQEPEVRGQKTEVRRQRSEVGGSVSPGYVRVAVAGAHLRGQPWNGSLAELGARFVRACQTAPRYRFVGLLDLTAPRPGLIRDEARAGSIAVEIYDLNYASFGKLVASVAPPLAIGTIELADGERVKGFLCESWALAQAHDITDFGGWSAFLEKRPVPSKAGQS
jgi:allophanate hydrolase